MLRLLHLLGLLYGALGLVWTKLLTTPGQLKVQGSVMDTVQTLFPPSLFSPTWPESEDNGDGTATQPAPDASKPYLISGGVFAYCLWALTRSTSRR